MFITRQEINFLTTKLSGRYIQYILILTVTFSVSVTRKNNAVLHYPQRISQVSIKTQKDFQRNNEIISIVEKVTRTDQQSLNKYRFVLKFGRLST